MNRASLRFALPLLAAVLLTTGCWREPQRFFLQDAQGRQMILHGLNIANTAKYSPTGFSWHTEADYARMRQWGFNAVRLLIFWHMIEPEEDVFDEVYLDEVARRVQWAANHGLVVLLDMHMDLYGRKFGENGAPVWATRDEGIPYDPIEPGYLNYIAPAVQAAYYHLYRDEDLKAHYFEMWAHVAARFANNPAVIGYDLHNEPFWGRENFFTFETDPLWPFYKGTIAAVRMNDPNALCFFKPVIQTSTGAVSFLPPIEDPRTAYSPHFYQVEQHNFGWPYDGNDAFMRNVARTRAREAERHGVPWVLAELGVAETVVNFDLHLHHLMRVLDDYASGWFYYDYEKGPGQQILDGQGNEKPNLWPLIRTYPQRVAGDIDRYSYDPDTRVFELTYREREGLRAETEIYVPAGRVYPEGFRVTSSDPEGAWSHLFDPDREVVSVWADPASPSHTIRIVPHRPAAVPET